MCGGYWRGSTILRHVLTPLRSIEWMEMVSLWSPGSPCDATSSANDLMVFLSPCEGLEIKAWSLFEGC